MAEAMTDKPRKTVTRAHVEQATNDLRARGLLADTGPGPDGTRSADQWLAAIREDAGLVQLQLEETMRPDAAPDTVLVALRNAAKEASRMQSDVRRFAHDIHGIALDRPLPPPTNPPDSFGPRIDPLTLWVTHLAGRARNWIRDRLP